MTATPPAQYTRVTEPDLPALARLLHLAFALEMESAEKWLRDAGLEHVRGVRADAGAPPAACLLRIPMGQHFGGRSVSMLGIAGVAASPETRGRGVAKGMMASAMREGAADGFAVSCLYASTLGLYRQVGFEQAGHQFTTTIPLGRIDVRERAGEVRPLTEADDGAVRDCYARFARPFNGTLDRGPYCWHRVRVFRGTAHTGFGVFDGSGSLGGYIFLSQAKDGKTGQHNLSLSDLAFASPAAARRLLGFLADFATMGETVSIPGGPLHPIVSLMSLRQVVASKQDYWMLRLLDIARALEQRGYPEGLSIGLGLRVEDELIPANAGEWRVSVEAGRARVVRGAADEPLCAHVRGLAAVYSGLYTASQAATLGWVSGSASTLAAADAVFSGNGTPWMTDRF